MSSACRLAASLRFGKSERKPERTGEGFSSPQLRHFVVTPGFSSQESGLGVRASDSKIEDPREKRGACGSAGISKKWPRIMLRVASSARSRGRSGTRSAGSRSHPFPRPGDARCGERRGPRSPRIRCSGFRLSVVPMLSSSSRLPCRERDGRNPSGAGVCARHKGEDVRSGRAGYSPPRAYEPLIGVLSSAE
jgi:hypothetical protein